MTESRYLLGNTTLVIKHMEIRWHIAHTHVLVGEYLHTGMTCKSKRCVKLCLFYSEHASQSVVLVKQCTQTRFHMSIVACREGFVSLKVLWLYFVSGTSVGKYVINRVSYVKSYACTCLSNSKSVQTCLFSARTRTRTRLVVDTVRGNMVFEIKHRKLCDKLYADTCFYEKFSCEHIHVSQKVV